MPLNDRSVELMAQWCLQDKALAQIRDQAKSEFFGDNEPGTVKYIKGYEEPITRERRFAGWFSFYFRMPEGRHPAELAAEDLWKSTELTDALKSIQAARYVMAITTMVVPGKTIFLALEDEEFEISNRNLSQEITKEDVLCAHIIPIGRKRWVLGPGWLVWPTRFGPGIRSHLKDHQLNPVEVERVLQLRNDGQEKPPKAYPKDKTLAEAVNRMTEAARTAGKELLIRSQEEWQNLVLKYMKADTFLQLSKDVAGWVGPHTTMDELNKWISLATNIWNNVPQPDRGNRSANQITEDFERTNKEPA